MQDIIDARATAGILLARQEAATADGKAVAAQESVAGEASARETADTVLRGRVEALEMEVADPVIEVAHWIKTGDARSFVLHIDPSTITTEVVNIRFTIMGVSKTVAKVVDQDVYAFPFSASDAATITRAAGNAGRDTITAETALLNNGGDILRRWVTVLRVLDEAPGAPAPVNRYEVITDSNTPWSNTGNPYWDCLLYTSPSPRDS